jgi:hypothetical protein
MKLVEKASAFAIDAHKKVNQEYGKEPYSTHLELVYNTALTFVQHMNDEDKENILAACWLHDVLEDVHFVSYNDLAKEFNNDIADAVYAVTNEKGKTRDERANDKYYKGIKHTPYATIVKLCDRIANTLHSKINNSTMHYKYKAEYPNFRKKLYQRYEHDSAWSILDKLNDYTPPKFKVTQKLKTPIVMALIIGGLYYFIAPCFIYYPSMERGILACVAVFMFGLYKEWNNGK